MSDYVWLKRQVLERLKRGEKLKLAKFLIFQPNIFTYCFHIIMLKRLKYPNVKKSYKIFLNIEGVKKKQSCWQLPVHEKR